MPSADDLSPAKDRLYSMMLLSNDGSEKFTADIAAEAKRSRRPTCYGDMTDDDARAWARWLEGYLGKGRP